MKCGLEVFFFHKNTCMHIIYSKQKEPSAQLTFINFAETSTYWSVYFFGPNNSIGPDCADPAQLQ